MFFTSIIPISMVESSEFKDNDITHNNAIDFSKATKLERGGSICECYTTRHFRRRVFVKRLKEEYRNSPLHLAALDKEFDVGASLSHPNLPHYYEIHHDYIIMDYIEGETLEEMIKADDPRLKDADVVRKILFQLVDVLEYLHSRHIVHCDIKADNILITPQGNNAILIDYDKCHTDWLDETDGDPSRYGLDESAIPSPQMDFIALGRLVGYLYGRVNDFPEKAFFRFEKLCLEGETNGEYLKKTLETVVSPRLSRSVIIVAILMAIGLALLVVFLPDSQTSAPVAQSPSTDSFPSSSPPLPESPQISNSNESSPEIKSFIPPAPKTNSNIVVPDKPQAPGIVTQEALDKELTRIFMPVKKNNQDVIKKLREGTTRQEVENALEICRDGSLKIITNIIEISANAFPGASRFELNEKIVRSPVYKENSKEIEAIFKLYAKRIDEFNEQDRKTQREARMFSEEETNISEN